ncbi:hypothetical protein MPH_02861 [Macrophomina phaseolina MS6]|uniref:NadR/Ttd14 AAA domain-containing protein n=1 Tax=Macrophomina phaseolina (strain MS6) TaxID=1126212 RepID=K2SBT3_MACPH|nr:hypothetical protein MPH_02861 [Macrophomina phaseolina MS6]
MFPNIYVVGAQSTGKTTLVSVLESHFANPDNRIQNGVHIPVPGVVREVARGVLIQHGFTRDDIRISPERCLELQQHILAAQWQRERDSLGESGWLISDRSGVDPIIYAQHFGGKSAACQLLQCKNWQELGERMRSSVVVLCSPEAKFLKDDGVRLMPRDVQEWEDLHKAFCNVLDENGIPYLVRDGVANQDVLIGMIRMEWNSRLNANLAALDVARAPVPSLSVMPSRFAPPRTGSTPSAATTGATYPPVAVLPPVPLAGPHRGAA